MSSTGQCPREASSAPPAHIAISDPWVSRYRGSSLLRAGDGPAGSEYISTRDLEVYGDPSHPIAFRIGNGGAGYTGILKQLSEAFIAAHGNNSRIGWVSNHSRHSQIALLADVVQVTLTYEPVNEDVSIAEGWARRVGRVFNDHFMLAGPARELGVRTIGEAMRAIAESHAGSNENEKQQETSGTFHSRGDGSATFAKEQLLWKEAGVDTASYSLDWIKTIPLTPYEALVNAGKEQAFLITDRATFLTAKRDGAILSLKAHVEGGAELLNPCSAMVWNFHGTGEQEKNPEKNDLAERFAEWLGSGRAQEIVKEYGTGWKEGRPLFTVAEKDEFDEKDRLC